VPNPEQMLGSASRILDPGGRIVITVPAFECLWTSHDDLNHHLRRYTAQRLRRTIREAGLVTESISYLFQSLVIPKLVVRAIETVARGTPQTPQVPSPPVNKLLRKWFQAESVVSKWLPFGTSLIAIARLPENDAVRRTSFPARPPLGHAPRK
jgi:hypothetical protein